MSDKNYLCLQEHYERCFSKYGDSHQGVDWPNSHDTIKRYQVMHELLSQRQAIGRSLTLLDVGCGAGHFLEYLNQSAKGHVNYIGHDISEMFVGYCRRKFPNNTFIEGDLLNSGFEWPQYDYAIMNGVFTEKRDMSNDEMFDFFTRMISKVFTHAGQGIAFNVMSKNVDWEREDLFHLSLDKLTHFVTQNLTRSFVIRNDYGLYEYTTYLLKVPEH